MNGFDKVFEKKCHCSYVYKGIGSRGSDMLRSVWDRIHYGMDPLCLHGTVSKQEQYRPILEHPYKWTQLVDSICTGSTKGQNGPTVKMGYHCLPSEKSN